VRRTEYEPPTCTASSGLPPLPPPYIHELHNSPEVICNLFHATHKKFRLKAVALLVWIYLVLDKISES